MFTRLGLLTALFAATVTAALAQQGSGTPSRSDNESSAMGNCFDRSKGIARNAVDPQAAKANSAATTAPSGTSGAAPSAPSASFAPNAIGQSRSGDPGKVGNDATANSSGLPDC